MALADIITRIEADADRESREIVASAEERAANIAAEAEQLAEEHRNDALTAATSRAEKEASRIVVSAKLSARDEALAARRALIDEALASTVDALASMPDAEYADFVARRIAAVARGGETLRFGSDDLGRAAGVLKRVAELAPQVELTNASAPAPFARGVIVEGVRVRADLSLDAIVDEARDELELVIAQVLFGEGE